MMSLLSYLISLKNITVERVEKKKMVGEKEKWRKKVREKRRVFNSGVKPTPNSCGRFESHTNHLASSDSIQVFVLSDMGKSMD